VLGEAKQVLSMPSGGLGERQPDGTYKVKVLLAGDRTEERTVRIGVNNNVQVEVLSGLKAGDKVVVSDAQDASVSGVPQPRSRSRAKGKG
jgi:macrolide-specific efflux system membrane fusion protein